MDSGLAAQDSRGNCTGEIQRPFPTPPESGTAVEIESGVFWLRLPLPMALDHVNVYALRDGDGWTVVDTGMNTGRTRSLWSGILQGPLEGRPVKRMILTHHHPDHVGLAGWFQSELGAEILATRTAWLTARMLTLDGQEAPTRESMRFYRRAGLPADMLEELRVKRPFNFADCVYPMPLGFRRLCEGDRLEFGDRAWTVRIGHGHAPSHATFWCEDAALVLGGDQFLDEITPNIGVYPTEPEANPLAEWLQSCERFGSFATDGHLVLAGHKRPYRGLPLRLRQLIENHERALGRLLDFLTEPATAHAALETVFERPVKESEYGMAIVECAAHLNFLLARGLIDRWLDPQGAWKWRCRTG